ncbi:MAG: CPBP family intramembrane metalloprotease [Clostridia bacterium]|nr:CPBP family intramembrane metalloprotease [Clostridia bacterium]
MTRENRARLALGVLLGLTLVRIPLAMMLERLLPDASVAPEVFYMAAAVQSVMMFALPGWLLMPSWRTEEEKRIPWVSWAVCLLAAVLTRTVATPLNAWWMQTLGAASAMLPEPAGVGGRLLMVLAVVVIPAAAEELFFRGALLTNLLQVASRTQALVLTTLMFALMHGSLAGLLGHLLISLVLTLLMLHTGRMTVPVMAHLAFNLMALVGMEVGAVPAWLCGLLLAALVIALLLTLPRGRERRLPAGEGLLCAAILAAMALPYLM